jgi:LemA protein
MEITLIVLAVLVVLAIFFVVGFNRLRTMNIRVDEAESGIDVALKRRFDLIPNLVETVKGYAAHEKSVFQAVTEARSAGQAAHTIGEKAAADAQLTQALVNLRAVAEAYPQLQAASNFAQLQEELTSTENRIAFSRQNYNAVVQQLNTAVRTIPWMLFSGLAGVTTREFYEIPDEAQRQAPKVEF